MKEILLKVMIKITDWCIKLAFRLELDKEYAEMLELYAKLKCKL